MNQVFKIQVNDFIDKVKLSNKQRPKYYMQGGKIPKRYLTKIGENKLGFVKYKTQKKLILLDLQTMEPILANPKRAGEAKFIPIKGNDFYSGFSHHSVRTTVVDAIKGNFLKDFSKIKKINQKEFPLYIEFEIFDVIPFENIKKIQDLDNKCFPYVKCGLDLMTRLGKIPDDNLLYIRKVSYEVIPCKVSERKIVITGYKYIRKQ
jgi:hypothetical protein